MTSSAFNSQERRTLISLSALFACRMIGLFMLVPVFALYAPQLKGYQPELLGIVIGGYGISQAILQIPFGLWSDRWGRKPVIMIGLMLFAAGSLLAASSQNVWGVILGRFLQGAGAVSGATLALAADLTREQVRSKMMAIIGIGIGLSFALAFMLGPLLAAYLGLSGLFWLIVGLAVLSMVILSRVPAPTNSVHSQQPMRQQLVQVMLNPQLLRLDAGIFILHLVLTASFVSIPVLLRDAGLAGASQAKLYLPVLLTSFMLMGMLMGMAARRGIHKTVFLSALLLLMLSLVLLGLFSANLWGMALALLVFFTAFNVLEGNLPSFISRVAPADSKGAALGVYSTVQFIGVALGGAVGGLVVHHWGSSWLFSGLALLLGVWWLLARGLVLPVANASQRHDDLPEPLDEFRGVADVALDDDHHS